MSLKTTALGALLFIGCTTAAYSKSCDRACLISTMDGYLAAVVAHDAKAAHLASGLRETQNAVDTPAGQGIWMTATALGTGVRYADPVSGEVGYYGTVQEAAGPAIAAVRLKVKDGAITESEWILARKGMAFYKPESFVAQLPRTRRPAGAADLKRDAAIEIANSYFEGIDKSNGDLVKADPECFRIENGTHTVGRKRDAPVRAADAPAGDGITAPLGVGITSCPSGFANLKNVTEDVIDRRFFYDAQAGIVWAHGTFQRVPGAKTRQGEIFPWLNFFELFEIDGGKIRGIYAAMNYLPAEITSSGWPAAKK